MKKKTRTLSRKIALVFFTLIKIVAITKISLFSFLQTQLFVIGILTSTNRAILPSLSLMAHNMCAKYTAYFGQNKFMIYFDLFIEFNSLKSAKNCKHQSMRYCIQDK